MVDRVLAPYRCPPKAPGGRGWMALQVGRPLLSGLAQPNPPNDVIGTAPAAAAHTDCSAAGGHSIKMVGTIPTEAGSRFILTVNPPS
jgi:hypothetical protein